MIRLHHLNQSRSLRILWLLEELSEPYEIISYQLSAISYQRDSKTNLAPDRPKKFIRSVTRQSSKLKVM